MIYQYQTMQSNGTKGLGKAFIANFLLLLLHKVAQHTLKRHYSHCYQILMYEYIFRFGLIYVFHHFHDDTQLCQHPYITAHES